MLQGFPKHVQVLGALVFLHSQFLLFLPKLKLSIRPAGKIMRRVLRQIARNEKDLGDLSTLADPKVVEVLFSQRCEAAA